MTVLITLTTADIDTGPFDLYSNSDAFVAPFETGVSKSALVAGYSSALVPDDATIIRVLSTGTCTNSVDINIGQASTSVYIIQGCRSGRLFYAAKSFTFAIGEVVYFTLPSRAIGETYYCGTITGSASDIPTDIILPGTKPSTGCGDPACATDSAIP